MNEEKTFTIGVHQVWEETFQVKAKTLEEAKEKIVLESEDAKSISFEFVEFDDKDPDSPFVHYKKKDE
jgi:uncharacterized protein YprB with RNaseH-like and TPR domain